LVLFVIPVQTGIQSFQAFLDARLRGHDSLFRKIIFEMASSYFYHKNSEKSKDL